MKVKGHSPVGLLFAALNHFYNPSGKVGDYSNPFSWNPALADTTLGRVRGTVQVARDGIQYFQFRGIPYAAPPLGNLRFEPPTQHERWFGERGATAFEKRCIQIHPVTNQPDGSEDCLYLNVYSRRAFLENEVPNRVEDFRPVIVYIHGGLFMIGSSDAFREKYFLDEDIVLLTFNYRLNSFGFLNSGDGIISGNMGLKDQTFVLHWIQANIRFFGGDPTRVTIMGESAGSVCAHLHTLSPMSRGLFSRVISQSGTALAPWAIVNDPGYQAIEYARFFNCPMNSSENMASCLKLLSADEIVKYHTRFVKAAANGQSALFGPTVEISGGSNSFLPAHPLKLMKAGKISKAPWISGVNSADGLVNLIPIILDRGLLQRLNAQWNYYAPKLMSYDNLPNKDNVSSDIWGAYLNEQVSFNTVKQAAAMLSDRNFFLDNHDAALLQSQLAPTYIYYYTYEGLFSCANLLFSRTPFMFPGILDTVVSGVVSWLSANVFQVKRQNDIGICHGDELAIFFNFPITRKEIDQNDVDYHFSKKMIKLWVTFAESGVPDPYQVGEDVTWNTVKNTNRKLNDIKLERLEINTNFKIIYEPFYDRIKFWKQRSITYI